MAAKPEADDADGGKKPAKSKKLLIIMVAVAVVLALAGGGVFYFLSKQHAAAAAEDDEDAAPAKSAEHAKPKTPPAYLPLDNMVVNLADPGGERVAQIGITLEVVDAHSVDTVKAFLPTIRSGILMLVSQRTAAELLSPGGKQKLAGDILRETTVPFGGSAEAPAHEGEEAPHPPKKKKKAAASEHAEFPVQGVLFSSFIVQ